MNEKKFRPANIIDATQLLLDFDNDSKFNSDGEKIIVVPRQLFLALPVEQC